MDSTPSPGQHIAVCVATLRRPRMLAACLEAVGRVTPPPGCRISVIVADNDAGGGARAVAERARLPFPLRYVIEPERGLAAVRNRLLDEAAGLDADWIAFLDDDEEPDPAWLAALLEAAARYAATVVTGPLLQVESPEDRKHARPDPRRPTGSTPRYVATNNVLFDARLVTEQGLRFDRYYDFIGGEDFDFFNRSAAQGNRHVWAAEALVFETVPPSRRTLRYLFYRHLSGGVNNVLRDRKTRGVLHAWGRFLPKILGKLLGGTVTALRAALTLNGDAGRKALKQLASALGYGAGLLNIVVERYRHIDGN